MEEKTCRKCGEVKPLSEYHLKKGLHINTCKTCRAAYHKSWREKGGRALLRKNQAEYRRRNADKVAARNAVREAVRVGALIRAAVCSHCGNASTTEAHHTDYTAPLAVTWLCAPCHLKAHKKTQALPTWGSKN